MSQWYLIQVKPNSHRLAERNLQRQGFETFIPMQDTTQRKMNCFINQLKPLFPGYMFVNVKSDITHWRKINSTIGVSRLVSFDGKPKTIPEKLISSLMLRCDDEGKILPSKLLKEGASVKFLSGPFANFAATVDIIDPEERVWVLMEFMQQQAHVQITTDQLELSY